MDRYRFYVPDLTPHPLLLPEDQAHHALRVLRLTEGTPVVVFDGRGGSAPGTLLVRGRQVQLALAEPVQQALPPARPLTLVTAVPKGDRADWLIEQASGLNVTTLQWLDAQRSVVRPRESGGKMEKWQRLAIESAKQCGRTHLLAIEPLRPLAEVLEISAGTALRLCLDPRSTLSVYEALPPTPAPVVAFVGPEGGWSPQELDLLAGAPNLQRVRLTPTILRIETAAAAIAAIVACRD